MREDLPPIRQRQFSTLKSALLSRQPDSRPEAGGDVHRGAGRVVHGAGRADAGRDRPQRIRQEHAAEARGRHHEADERQRHRQRPHLGADRARRRLPSGDLRPRERLHQRHHARPHEARGRQPVRRDRRVRRAAGLHRRAGEDLLVRHVHAPRDSRSRFTSIPMCCSSTKCSPSATRASRTSASTSSPSSSGAARPSCSSPTRSAWSSASATKRCGSTAAR